MNSVKRKTEVKRRPAPVRPPSHAVQKKRARRVHKFRIFNLTIALRKFRTKKERRSSRYKQMVAQTDIFGIREVALVFPPRKTKRRRQAVHNRLYPLPIKTTAAIALMIAGFVSSLYFGTHLQKPVSFNVPITSAKVLAAPPPAKVLPKSDPVSLQIPKLGIDTPLAQMGLQANGQMEMPWDIGTAAWYKYSPTPGELGPSVIVGHLDGANYADLAGIFYRLHELKPGDEISVARADGSVAKFKVLLLKQVPQNNFPTGEVYGNINYAGIRLITCGGTFNDSTGHYNDNTVVYGALE